MAFLSSSRSSTFTVQSATSSSKKLSPSRDSSEITWNDTSSAAPPKAYTSLDVPVKRGRKGHHKSRRGCLNCKKARVKCKEDHPICEYCRQRGFDCRWPDLQILVANTGPKGVVVRIPRSRSKIERVPKAIQSPRPVFTIQDFRLFDHFIRTAYPHHPLGNDSVWVHEIACISSQYDYLLHAMLALSASDLVVTKEDEPSLQATALAHRVKAISSLNAAMTIGIDTFEKGNAMLATCFSLLFQSALIADGLIEYMAFIRGIVAVAIQMGMRKLKFLFHSLFGDENIKPLQPGLEATPLIDAEIVAQACRSLELVGSLEMSKAEKGMYGSLLSSARTLVTSSMDAYVELRKIYALFSYTMTHEEFRHFTDPSNEVGKILQSHFVAMQLIMTPITKAELIERNATVERRMPPGITVHWLTPLHSAVSTGFEKYYAWPKWVESEVKSNSGRIFDLDH